MTPTQEQELAWMGYRIGCLRAAMPDPGPCPAQWPAGAEVLQRIMELLESDCTPQTTKELEAAFTERE